MRVHSLSVTAFGPFADTVVVDLDALSRDALFLLCGPTGSGKTSLLDAIAFALYGRVPGARGQEKRLRSDHASATVRTEVSCELTLRGERIRVTRRPEQERPKSRGGGTTRDQARLQIQRQVAGRWDPVSSRLDEGGDYLRTQVGLSPEQFWQVVLLPQGQFAEFLRAEPDERAKVLETLFDARRFADVETWLAEQARQRAEALSRAEEVVDRLLHRVQQASRGLVSAGVDPPPIPAPEDVGAIRGYVGGQLDRALAQVEVAAARDDDTGSRLLRAAAARDLSRTALRAGERFLAACRQRDFIDGLRVEHGERRAKLAAAAAAEPLRSLLDAQISDRDRLGQLGEELAGSLAALAVLDPTGIRPARLQAADPAELLSSAAVNAAGADLRRWSRALRDEIARLAELGPEAEELGQDEARVAELLASQRERAGLLDELTGLSGQLPAVLADLDLRLDVARVAAAGADHATRALAEARNRLAAATRASELTQLISAAETEQAAVQRAELRAKEEWLNLREARLAGIAAELAGQLVDDQDCPVCGSRTHPVPAEPTEQTVTAADERAAAQRYEHQQERTSCTAARVAELRREADLCASISSNRRPASIGKELTAAVSADAAAQAAIEQLPALDSDRAGLAAARDDALAEIRALTDAQIGDRATEKELSARVRLGRRRMDKARAEDASVDDRVLRLTALVSAAETVEAAESACCEAVTTERSSSQKLDTRLRRSAFDSPDAAATALLDDAAREELAAAVVEHDAGQIAATAELSSAVEELAVAVSELGQVAQLPAEWAPIESSISTELPAALAGRFTGKLAGLRVRLDDEHRGEVEARDDAVAAHREARRIRDELAELRVLLDQGLTQCLPLRETSERASSLAALVAGGGANLKKMRLRSYVLAARLEQVASAATARLRQMSSGRYGFVHSDDLRGGNRRSGLSLDILDGHTGVQRPTKTLSGGESFMAALALALGLADVVTAESGGITLDTLFVDEGFGGLDPDSLDAVMTVLDELRRSGRVVAIVSHVEELRARVPMQLQLRTGSHGSWVASHEPGPGGGEVADRTGFEAVA